MPKEKKIGKTNELNLSICFGFCILMHFAERRYDSKLRLFFMNCVKYSSSSYILYCPLCFFVNT